MVRFVSGRLEEIGETEVVIENGGIGYAIFVPSSVLEKLPEIGEEVKLYTYFSVREDAIQLFGFLNRADLMMYKLLITVNGIGPKAGMAIMSTMSADEFRYAVVTDDAKAIAKTPGIGPKTASKVILELKDKIDIKKVSLGKGKKSEVSDELAQNIADAVEALEVLGYSKAEATEAVGAVEVSAEMTVEELLKQSLRNI